jgi:hypothetical protein
MHEENAAARAAACRAELKDTVAHLDKANVLCELAEALPVDVQPVLADQTPVAPGHAAAKSTRQELRLHLLSALDIERRCFMPEQNAVAAAGAPDAQTLDAPANSRGQQRAATA